MSGWLWAPTAGRLGSSRVQTSALGRAASAGFKSSHLFQLMALRHTSCFYFPLKLAFNTCRSLVRPTQQPRALPLLTLALPSGVKASRCTASSSARLAASGQVEARSGTRLQTVGGWLEDIRVSKKEATKSAASSSPFQAVGREVGDEAATVKQRAGQLTKASTLVARQGKHVSPTHTKQHTPI